MSLKPVADTSSSSASLAMGLSNQFGAVVGELANEVSAVVEPLSQKMVKIIQEKFPEPVRIELYQRYNAVVTKNLVYPNGRDAAAGLKHFQENYEFTQLVNLCMEIGEDLEVYDNCLKIFQNNTRNVQAEIAAAYKGHGSTPGFSDRSKEKIAYKMQVKKPLEASLPELKAGIEALFDPSTRPLASASRFPSITSGLSSDRSQSSSSSSNYTGGTGSSTRTKSSKSSKVDSDDEDDKKDTRFRSKPLDTRTRTTTTTTTSTVLSSHTSSTSSGKTPGSRTITVPSELTSADEIDTFALLSSGLQKAKQKAGVEDSSESEDSSKGSRGKTSSKRPSGNPSSSSSLTGGASRSNTSSNQGKDAKTRKDVSQPEHRTGAGGRGAASHVDSNTQGGSFKTPVNSTNINLNFGGTGTDGDAADSDSSESSS